MANLTMQRLRSAVDDLSRSWLPLALQGTRLTFAYGTTLVVVLLSLWLISQREDPAAIEFLLGYYLICTIVSGIDPGTARASLIDPRGRLTASHVGLVGSSLVQSVPSALIFAALWLFTADPGIPLGALVVWSLLLTCVGFVTTNYRNLLDFEGRHTAAIWLKQGSLSLAVAVVVTALLLGFSASEGIAAAIVTRIAWIMAFLRLIDTAVDPEHAPSAVTKVQQWLLLPGWGALAAVSVLAALSGSVDRIVVLQSLATQTAADYFILVEVLSKFWLFSYILAPILFARRARGDGGLGLSKAVLFISAIGLIFVGMLAVLLFVWTFPIEACCGGIGGNGGAVLLLAVAYVINALSQLFSSDLQARGQAKTLAVFSAAMLLIFYPVFTVAANELAMLGIALAWFGRATLELIFFVHIARKLQDNGLDRGDRRG